MGEWLTHSSPSYRVCTSGYRSGSSENLSVAAESRWTPRTPGSPLRPRQGSRRRGSGDGSIPNRSRLLHRRRTGPRRIDGDEDQDGKDPRGEVGDRSGVERLLDQLAPDRVGNPGPAEDEKPAAASDPEPEKRDRAGPSEV